jgi:hypothetical protein
MFDSNPELHRCRNPRKSWSLHHGGSTVVGVVPDADSLLYRIIWPDIGLSPPANLPRCMDAARQWAEQRVLTEHPKLAVAQRLKLLNNFSWSSSLVRQNDLVDPEPLENDGLTSELPNRQSWTAAAPGPSPGRQSWPARAPSSQFNGAELLFVRQQGDLFQVVGSVTNAVLKEFGSQQAASAWIDGRVDAPPVARFRRAAR